MRPQLTVSMNMGAKGLTIEIIPRENRQATSDIKSFDDAAGNHHNGGRETYKTLR